MLSYGMILRLWLPFPPSLNSLYPGKIRRHKSKKYEAWIREAGTALNQQYKFSFDQPVQVTYKIGKPITKKGETTKVEMDLANREKALSDLLVTHGVLKDDCLIHRLVMEWADINGCDIAIDLFKTGENLAQTPSIHSPLQ